MSFSQYPQNPVVGQEYTVGNMVVTWDGTKFVSVVEQAPSLDQINTALAELDDGLTKLNSQELLAQINRKATLDLRFNENQHRVYEPFGLTDKLLTDALTTTRGSTATYNSPFGIATAAINTPRIEYDPTTGECLGLLCEEQRTNLLLESSLGRIGWPYLTIEPAAQNRTINQPDPTGGNNALLFEDISTTALPTIRQIIPITSPSNSYCISIYAKAGSSGKCYMRYALTGGSAVLKTTVFDFATETFVGGSGTSFEKHANGWYRLIVAISDNNTGNSALDWRVGATADTQSATGSVVIFGGQVETGSYHTSYIKTESSQVTRAPDRNKSQRTPTPTAATIYAEVDIFGANTDGFWAGIIKLCDESATASRGLEIQYDDDSFRAIYRNSAGVAAPIPTITKIPTGSHKVAAAFDQVASILKIAVDGQVASVSMGAIDPLDGITDYLHIGDSGSVVSGTYAPGSMIIAGAKDFPRCLSDAELQELTRL